MDILYALEKIRTPFWNGVMSAVTQLGGEVIFIVAAVVVFWCVSKWEGYYLMTIAFCGTVLNQFLKLICRVPRPWVRDPNFTIVESARAEATGYSFPSGHTQNAIGLFGGMARWGGRRWVRLGLTALALVIAFSRMYLGVHTPADVGVSLVLAAALVLGLYPLMRRAQEKPRYMAMCWLPCWWSAGPLWCSWRPMDFRRTRMRRIWPAASAMHGRCWALWRV